MRRRLRNGEVCWFAHAQKWCGAAQFRICMHAADNGKSYDCGSFKSSKEDNITKTTLTVWKETYTACKIMVTPAELFPSEVWNHVFSYLSAAEKSCVRASCTYFRKLIDHPSLWRDWSVVLDCVNGSYDTFFWETLRRRKVTSVVLRNNHSKHMKVLASSLPAVSILVMDGCVGVDLQYLNNFKNLKSLAIRSAYMVDFKSGSTESLRQQLTHLSLCKIPYNNVLRNISVVCQFKNLTSLTFHERNWGIPFSKINFILVALPKLEHLSLHVYFPKHTDPDNHLFIEPNARRLTSLEIFGTGRLLPVKAMKHMSQLKRFAVFYENVPREMPGNEPLSVMSDWLSDLHDLSTLVIVKGPPVKTYVSSIPVTLTDLTLHDSNLSLEDMAAVAAQIPNLQHLHLDTWPSHLGANASQIPKLFPNLKSLKIRHEHIPEKNFLDLHQLQDLEILEIVDSHPDLPALVRKLRILTKYRLRVLTPPYQRDVLSCPCVC